MNAEMQSVKENQVWSLVDLSPNGKTVRKKMALQEEDRYGWELNGGVVDWKSAKQITIDMSSTDTEYIVASKAAMEAV
ncbi:hypothetical protein Tco_1046389 [Tanacetum coccineum]